MGSKYQDIRFKWMEERGVNLLADKHQYAYAQALWSPVDLVQGVFCEANSGTGKTITSVLTSAYEVLKGTYKRIVYVRNTEVVGKDVGFLTGDFEAKTMPHMLPFVEALDKVEHKLFDKWHEEGKAIATTPTHMRGVTFDDAVVIIDEAQNMSLLELQTIFTRVTDTTKIVCIGSLRQIDNDKLKRIAGLTPFEVFMKHFEGTKTAYCKLSRNFRGIYSEHSDNIQETVKKLKNGDINTSEKEREE